MNLAKSTLHTRRAYADGFSAVVAGFENTRRSIMVVNVKTENEFAKDYICSLTDHEKCLAFVNRLRARVERRNGRIRSRRPTSEMAEQMLFSDFQDAA